MSLAPWCYYRDVADVRPFRALRFNPDLDPARAVCPPFDTISPEQQRALYEVSDYNAVRIELAEEGREGRYANAAATLAGWRARGIIQRDERPAYYVYEQIFPRGDRSYTRKLIFARVRVHPWADGVVLPHEQTFGAPKEDRLALMRATHLNASPVFMLHRGEEIARRAESARGTVVAEFATEDGQRHRLSRIASADEVAAIEEAFRSETLYIADGHHRYETALGYRDEVRAKAPAWTGEEAENFVMTALAWCDDPGLLVLPIHRVTRGGGDWEAVQARLEPLFSMAPVEGGAAAIEGSLRAAGGAAWGLATYSSGEVLMLKARDPDRIDHLLPRDHSAAWRALDYSVANYAIMRHGLGLSDEAMRDYKSVQFTEDAAEAVSRVRSGDARYAILLNPVPAARVLELADAGERMPQKSTFFYPKVPTGLVFNLLED